MKITKIHIEEFHQFKNLEIDLTYPLGHAKAGQPLDKVCIIGQSGTGKTTLLKIIGGYTYTINDLFNEYPHHEFEKVKVFRKLNDLENSIRVIHDNIKKENIYGWENYKIGNLKVEFEEAVNKHHEYLEKIKTQFIFFPADLRYDFVDSSGKSLSDNKIIDFRKEKLGDIWNIVLSDIQKSQEEELKLRNQISKIAEKEKDINKINIAVKKLERFKNKKNNPISDIADNCLDPLLKNFNLRVKRELDFQTKEDIGFIKIEDLEGNEIPHGLLSTGTKQVLLTALPLYLLKPEDALILYDEPERSLYPSIQKLIIDFYTSLTKNSQFFFATHSPIIASCFEPWEIVELKFNSKGNVVQELYYENERHVDNYKIIPSYLTYDLILSKVFDIDQTHSNERSDKIAEVLMLRNQLKDFKLNNKLGTVKAKKIYAAYKDLSSKLFWDFDIN